MANIKQVIAAANNNLGKEVFEKKSENHYFNTTNRYEGNDIDVIAEGENITITMTGSNFTTTDNEEALGVLLDWFEKE